MALIKISISLLASLSPCLCQNNDTHGLLEKGKVGGTYLKTPVVHYLFKVGKLLPVTIKLLSADHLTMVIG
jgi:hypothetical protein